MNKHKWLIFAAITALLLLNIWRWLPTDEAMPSASNAPAYSISVDKLRLLVDPAFEAAPMVRNPFNSAPEPEPEAMAEASEQVPTPVPPEEVPAPLAGAAQLETALGHLKLGGVVYRNGARYAYLLESGQGHLVEQGTVLFGRYRVEEINARSVNMKDMTSGAAARLSLSEM